MLRADEQRELTGDGDGGGASSGGGRVDGDCGSRGWGIRTEHSSVPGLRLPCRSY